MPMAIPLIGAAFMAAGSIMTAVGVTAAIAGISLATIATVAGVALMAVSMLTMQVPKPSSIGSQLDTKLSVKAPVPVLYGRSATGGTLVYRELSGDKNKYLWMAIALSAAGPIEGVEYAYANDVGLNFSGNPSNTLAPVVSTTPTSKKLYRNKFWMRYLRGETPSTTTISQALGGAPKNPGLASGVALVGVKAEYDTDEFPQGLPKMLWVGKGVKVYDPRKDSTYPGGNGAHRFDNPATWEFSENPYLCALHWTRGTFANGLKTTGIGVQKTEIDFPAFVRGANVSDANGWKCGGATASSDDKFAVLSTILAAGGGVPIARGAQISCHVNTPLTTVATITASDIVSSVEIQNSTSLRDRYNTVIPSYREPSQFWEIISGEQVTSSVYVEEDNGLSTSKEVEFSMVQQAAQAHQLATYNLVNSREMLTFTVGLKMRALSFRVGDAVVVDVPEIAAQAVKCLVINREYNPTDSIVTVTLKSESDAKHAFALGQSQVAPPTIELTGYDPSDMDAPGSNSWAVQGGTLSIDGGSAKPIIRVTGQSDNPYTAQVVVEYRPTGFPAWFTAGSYPRDTQSIEITSVTANTSYDVSVAYRSIAGALSDKLIFSGVIAGDEAFGWSAVTGPGRPEDGATVGAPPGTLVGGVPAEELVDRINNVSGVDIYPVFEMVQEVAQIGRRNLTAMDRAAAGYRDEAMTHVDELRTDVLADGTNWQSAIDGLTTKFNTQQSAISSEAMTRSNADEALSSQVNIVAAKADANEAALLDESTARATALEAQSTKLSELEAATQAAHAGISDEQIARANAISAETSARTQQVSALGSSVNAAIQSEATSRASGDGALGTRIDQVNAIAADAHARITTAENARVAGDNALASTVATVQANAAQTANTLAIVQQYATANSNRLGEVEAQAGLSVQAGNTIVGWKALASAAGTSQLVFQADAVAFRNPSTGGAEGLMEFKNGKLSVRSAAIGDASIKTAHIEQLSVGTDKIAFNSVVVPHAASLSGVPYGRGVGAWYDIISYNLFAQVDCDLFMFVNGAQSFPDGDKGYGIALILDNQTIRSVGGSKTSDSPALQRAVRVGAGWHNVKVAWHGHPSVSILTCDLTILESKR